MRQFNRPVFDEVVYADVPYNGADYSGTFYTSYMVDYLLGQYDQLAIQAIADDVKGNATAAQLNVTIETSCDGRHWVPKSNSAEISASLNLLDTTLLPWGYDDGQRPSYAFVRLRVEIICTRYPGSAHLVIHVTGRDSGGVTVRTAAKSVYNFVPPPRAPQAPPETPEEIYKRCRKLGYQVKACVEAAKL